MADDKIVTKKTAAKPAAPANKTPPKAAAPAKTVAKKAVPKPAPQMTRAGAAAAAVRSAPAVPGPATGQAPHPASDPAPDPASDPALAPVPTASPVAAAAPQARAVPKAASLKSEPGELPLADPDVHPAPLEEKPVSLQGLVEVTPDQRLGMIREAAYYKAERRGFQGGNDADDWADAEREIDDLLAKAKAISGA